MIEINLLPEDMRKTEGTPLPRLAVYFASVALAAAAGFFLVGYYFQWIPRMQQDIEVVKVDIKQLTLQEEQVKKVKDDINNLNQKVAAVDNLTASRIRYARLLDRLCDAVNDVSQDKQGAWFRSFTVNPDNVASGMAGGKRYKIDLVGYTVGESQQDRGRNLTSLMDALKKNFCDKDVDTATGINRYLNAKFDAPHLSNFTQVEIPQPADPVLQKQAPIKGGLDFTMYITFELPPPKPPGT